MACHTKSYLLVANQQLVSNPDGTMKVYWSESMSFQAQAIFLRALFLAFAANTAVRIRGRYSVDQVTWTDVGATGGVIDGQTAAFSSVTTTPTLNYQYTGQPSEHAEFFQIGIEVKSTAAALASVTMSLGAVFGDAVMQAFDTGATGTLATAATPTAVTGTVAQQTAGYSKIRIVAHFQSTPSSAVTFYLATGSTSARLTVCNVSAATSGKEVSFIVENPGNWSQVYYSTAANPTTAIDWIEMILIP